MVSTLKGALRIVRAVPEAEVYTLWMDPALNEKAYILPGLGDAGDRINGRDRPRQPARHHPADRRLRHARDLALPRPDPPDRKDRPQPLTGHEAIPRRLSRWLPDAAYFQLLYLKYHGRVLHSRRPRTFNEKLQWYKRYYRDPLMTTLADKLAVRGYLEARGHGHLLNELYGVYDRPEEIDFDQLPESFVLKATHGSNMNIICRDRKHLDLEKSRAEMRSWLARDYYHSGRQWCYKGIRPRLICEKYLENEEFGELLDYKFYCFGGEPEFLWICSGRYGATGVAYNAYDMKGQRVRCLQGQARLRPGCPHPGGFRDHGRRRPGVVRKIPVYPRRLVPGQWQADLRRVHVLPGQRHGAL